MRILLVRHGDPDYATDSLTEAGRAEAKALARRLAKHGVDRLFSSSMGRARETAAHIGEAVGLHATVLPWTRELGTWGPGGETKAWRMDCARWGFDAAWDMHGETVRAQAPWPTSADWTDFTPVRGSGCAEAFAQLQAESDAWLASLGYQRDGGRYRIVAGNRDTICLACHGGFGLTWLAHLLELPVPLVWTGFFLPCSSVTTILFDERSPEWAVPRAIGVGDISHLYEAGLPMSLKGIKANCT